VLWRKPIWPERSIANTCFFNGKRVARKDFPGGAVSYYFSDTLKTADVITDSAGNIKAESDYYPYGGELPFISNDSNKYKYGGHERDSETGLDYDGARYYSSPFSRFLTPDWSSTPVAVPYADLNDPQSLNQYAYTRNNPITKGDPDGHQQQAAATLTTAAITCAAVEPCGAGMAAGAVAAAPVLGMVVAVAIPPIQNTPDGSPNLILDALNPPYIPAPPLTTTNPGQTRHSWANHNHRADWDSGNHHYNSTDRHSGFYFPGWHCQHQHSERQEHTKK